MRKTCALAALAIVLIFTGSCAKSVESRRNVVVIVVDTLRADRLGTYGCPRGTAPFLEELARKSLVFDNAWSPSSWTLPAAVSTMTSVHPFQHGVTNFDGLELAPGEEPIPVNCIPDEVETLAETLGRAGYRTYGVVSNILVGAEVGFDRGFDRYVKLEDDDADAVNAHVMSWREEMLRGEPYFLYVHYIDPHDEFHAREPWFEEALADGEAGWIELAAQLPDTFASMDWLATRLDPGPEWLGDRRASELSAEELQRLIAWMRAAYDSEIGFVDSRICELYERLGMEDAIVFVLADHGEEFYEHGALTHGQNLYSETVRVPLFLSLPGDEPPSGRIEANVTTLDLVPTLRALLGLPASGQDQGRDLLREHDLRPILGHLAGKAADEEFDGELRSVVFGEYRLITSSDGRVELYDILLDPGETIDLAQEEPDVVEELLGVLDGSIEDAHVYPRATRIPGVASDAMLEHLSGIGYAGGDD